MNLFQSRTMHNKSTGVLPHNDRLRRGLATSIGILLSAGIAPCAQSATHHVANNADNGAGSLRQAIIDANNDVTMPNTVVFDNTVTSAITLTTGHIAVENTMTIQGPGADALTVSGNNNSRIFYVHAPTATAAVTISGLTLSNGKAGNGGAVLSINSDLLLSNCVISNSTAGFGGGGVDAYAIGGAVDIVLSGVTLQNNSVSSGPGAGGAELRPGVSGTAIVENSIITGNVSASGGAGGLYFLYGSASVVATRVSGNTGSNSGAGGITAMDNSLSMTDSTISGNIAGGFRPGGVYVYDASLVMDRTLVSANHGYVGGISIYSVPRPTIISDSTITGNTASGDGAGIAVHDDTNIPVELRNVTIVGNTTTAEGGGLFSEIGNGGTGQGVLTIESSTITNNHAATGGGVVASVFGIPVTLNDSVIANNTAAVDADVNGTFTANHNFIRNAGSATLNGTANITTGADPLLGSLGNYGGPTPTKLPLPGSPLIDAGDPAGNRGNTDQRGLLPNVGAHIDIGADERQTSEDTIFLDGLEGY